MLIFSPKLRTLHFIGDADETGLLSQNADGDGILVTQSSTKFCTELHGVSLKWIVLRELH